MGENFKLFKKIWNIFAWILVLVVLAGATAVALPGFFGVKVMNVESDSMAVLQNPTITQSDLQGHVGQFAKGSLIYVDTNAQINEIEKFDVVTQQVSKDTLLTHRVVDVQTDANGNVFLKTHGDTNEDADPGKVTKENLVGKVVFAVPFAGAFMTAIQASPILAVVGVIILLLIMFVPDIISAVVVLWKGDDQGQAPQADGESGEVAAPAVPQDEAAEKKTAPREESDKDGE